MRIEYKELKLMPFPSPWGGGRWSYNGVPYTGVSFVKDEISDVVLRETSYVDGYEEGLEIEYWSNGLKQKEHYLKDDFIYNYSKIWDEQGNLIYHVTYDNFGNKVRIIKHSNPDLEE